MTSVVSTAPDLNHDPATVTLMGMPLLCVSEAQTVQLLIDRRRRGVGTRLLTANTDILRHWHRQEAIREAVGPFDYAVADGMPLIWASRLKGSPLPERVCGSNLILSLSAAAAQQRMSMFLLGGGEEDLAQRTAEELIQRYPGLTIAGTYFPPFGFEKDPSQIEAMRAAVAAAQPDIVLIAIGFPKGERLIRDIRSAAPRAIWVGVGISFSFVCGDVKRAPRWAQRLGIEWVHRLIQEPRRLIRRYLIDDVPFALRLLWDAAASRRRRL